METVTQRRRPHQRGNESAAIALTARLLSGLKTSAAEAICLIPSSDVPRYCDGAPNFALSARTGSSFQRRHGSEHGTTWFGTERLLDQHGRKWERGYDAVIDDFGNLVEVAG